MTMTNKFAALVCAGALVGAVQSHAGTVTVSADITVDTTWTSDNTYVLTQPIFVREGAILTIEAGTLIRGEKEVSTDPGALVISRGSKIRAMGTKDAPIVMTDMLDDHYVGPTPAAGTAPYSTPNNGMCRHWGGLILLGETYLATDVAAGTPSPDASLELQIEGLEPYGAYSKYGGGNDDDDSGEIHYVSIRYGGFVLGDANEINGLTMGAVGRGTEIDHVEVFQNKDDGFEWFGGTVNTKHLIAWAVGDDSFDWDEGFRGKGQFWLCVQGPLSEEGDVSDKLAEMDGADGDSSQPSACPTVFNVTGVGHGKATGRLKNTAWHFRDGTGGRYYNSMVLDFGGACALVEGDPANGTYEAADNALVDYVQDAYYTHQPVANAMNKKLEMNRMLFWRMGMNGCPDLASGSGQAGVWGASSGDVDKPHYGYPLFTSPLLKNAYRADHLAAPVTAFTRAATPINIGGTDYHPIEYLDPTVGGNETYLTAGLQPPNDGFFNSNVRFIGAFGQINWAAPWSTAYKLGMLYSDIQEGAPVAIAMANGSEADITVAQGTPVTLSGEFICDINARPQVDWWILIEHVTAGSWSYYTHSTQSWTWNGGQAVGHQSKMQDVYGFDAIKNLTGLTVGDHTFYFGCDDVQDGTLNGNQYMDAVTVTVTP